MPTGLVGANPPARQKWGIPRKPGGMQERKKETKEKEKEKNRKEKSLHKTRERAEDYLLDRQDMKISCHPCRQMKHAE